MMFFGKIFTIISAVLVIAVNGSPIAANGSPANGTPAKTNGSPTKDNGSSNVTDSKVKAGLGNMQLCTDTGLNNCATLAVDADVCKGVPTGFDNDISSVGLGQGMICTLFDDVNCGGKSVLLKSNTNNLADVGFDDITSAVKCSHA